MSLEEWRKLEEAGKPQITHLGKGENMQTPHRQGVELSCCSLSTGVEES